jgi:hypothetical protein
MYDKARKKNSYGTEIREKLEVCIAVEDCTAYRKKLKNSG